jgi:hypothetical protein
VTGTSRREARKREKVLLVDELDKGKTCQWLIEAGLLIIDVSFVPESEPGSAHGIMSVPKTLAGQGSRF